MQTNTTRKVIGLTLAVFLPILMALNYQIFILPNAFAPAGINGIATMLQYLFDFKIGYMSLIVNIPLFFISFVYVGRNFSLRTLSFVLIFSFAMLFFENNVDLSAFKYHTSDGKSTILAPIAAGAINGVIYAYTLKYGSSTGGTDYVAAMVHKKYPKFPMLRIIFIFNVAVAFMSYFVYHYNMEPVILCFIYTYLTTQVSDHILRGGKQAIKAEIITPYKDELTQRLINDLHHSVTILDAQGGYSHKKKTMLICIINKHQMVKFANILGEFPNTFACVSSVNETIGNFVRVKK